MTLNASLTLLLIVVCAPPIAAQKDPPGSQASHHSKNGSALRLRVPPTDPVKFRGVIDAKDWRNPYIVVCPEGVLMLGVTPVGQFTPVESVPNILEQLPSSAWPYGLIVALSEGGLTGVGDEPRISANRETLLKLLKKISVPVTRWP